MTLRYSLLEDSLISVRMIENSKRQTLTLPELFVALEHDQIRDFPALRPHQRHPWHAFLVQLAALALHQNNRTTGFDGAEEWKHALLALTPDDPDGAPWHLIAPPERPALLQPPVARDDLKEWKNHLLTPDELDMLVTSTNHDLKAARMRQCRPEDWLFSLLSLQTQEGVFGAGNYGISRMNGGFASRAALGAVPPGGWGKRWSRDTERLIAKRPKIIEDMELPEHGGIALVWVCPWDGNQSLSFTKLDPFYIEICRRIRLIESSEKISAKSTGSKQARIAAKERNGITGDAWMPIEKEAGKALTISGKGFDYKLTAELLFNSGKFSMPISQELVPTDGSQGIMMLARGITRGQGKTEGYHERRIPISPRIRSILMRKQTDLIGKIAQERIAEISKFRSILWTALATLFDNGKSTDRFSDGAKDKASIFVQALERHEDSRFFDGPLGLNEEIESDEPQAIRLQWHLDLVNQSERILNHAFNAGPRSGEQRYRARAIALNRLHGSIRSPKTIPSLANYYKAQKESQEASCVQP